MKARVPFLDLGRGLAHPWGDLLDAQAEPVKGARFLAGPYVAEFERRFGALCGAEATVAVGSGTAALTLGLRALGLKRGDRVATPAFGCPATVAAIVDAGGEPRFVDVDPATGLAGPEQFYGVRLVEFAVPVHLFGRAVDVQGIRTVLDSHVRILEDAAQAVGVAGVGRHGDAAAWSFYPTKNLGAFGDAGAITFADGARADRARRLRQYGDAGGWAIEEWGVCSRMDEQQAAVLLGKLPLLPRWQRERRRAFDVYAMLLPAEVCPWERESGDAWNHHLLPVLVDQRARVRSALLADEVETGVHYPVALCDYPASAEWRGGAPWPAATAWAARELSLPLYPGLRDEEIRRVCDALRKAIG